MMGCVVYIIFFIIDTIIIHNIIYNLHVDISHGVLAATKKQRVVPYGFKYPITWTDEMPCDQPSVKGYSKFEAVPKNVLDLLLPRDLNGQRVGTSIFISDDRTDYKKERDLHALRL